MAEPSEKASPPSRHAPTLERGQTIGRFVVLGLVGRGGMGEVYAAYDPELERKVAVKLLRPRASRSVDARTRLLREAQAIAKLSHPNVVVVYDVGTYRESVFLAMEFVDGSTVSVWLAFERRSWREILKVFVAAGRGLAAAHEADLVHRDFKPENVMVTKDGQVRVMDFGLARRVLDPRRRSNSHEMAGAAALQAAVASPVEQDLVATQPLTAAASPEVSLTRSASSSGPTSQGLASKLTQTGTRVGTPAYMAPEQFAGAASDARTDQFSFCVALYEALYGERPFKGDDIPSLMTSVMTGAVSELPAASRVPAWIRRILMRGLRTDPAARFPTMGALLDALNDDPGARRRKWATIGAGLVGMLAAAAFASRVGNGQRMLCDAGGARLGGVWETGGAATPRKQAIQRSFSATGKAYAQQAFLGVSHLLDQYVGRWVAMYTEACQATQIRGEQSAEVLDLRMACLHERLGRVRALTDVLAHADSGVVENAVSAAGALPALDRCSDVPLLRAVIQPPDDPDKRRLVAIEREQLARFIALRDSGQCRAVEKRAPALVAAAEQSGYLPLLAETLNAVAYSGSVCGDEAHSIDLFKQAYAAAIRSRHDLAAAEAAANLTMLAEDRGHDHRTAKDWLLVARATLERIGSANNPLIEAWVLVAEGRVLASEGHLAAAIEAQRRARAIKEKALGPDHPETIASMANVALALQEGGRLQEAIDANREAAAAIERTIGKDHPMMAPVRNNLGEEMNAIGHHAEARNQFELALEIWRRAGSDPSLVSYALTGLGIALLDEGRYDEAVPPLEEALQIRTEKHMDAQQIAEVRFALARAVARGPAGHTRARVLALAARDAYASAGERQAVAAIDDWLERR